MNERCDSNVPMANMAIILYIHCLIQIEYTARLDFIDW